MFLCLSELQFYLLWRNFWLHTIGSTKSSVSSATVWSRTFRTEYIWMEKRYFIVVRRAYRFNGTCKQVRLLCKIDSGLGDAVQLYTKNREHFWTAECPSEFAYRRETPFGDVMLIEIPDN